MSEDKKIADPVKEEAPKPTKEEAPKATKSSREKNIEIRILGHSGSEVNFTIKTTTKLGAIKREYCETARLKFDRVVFTYDNYKVHDHDTPRSLKMGNREIIEVHAIQTGKRLI